MEISSSTKRLNMGIVLVPDFTMLAFAGLVDTLRLAADERDRSRPIHCQWHIMTSDGRAVRSSSGVVVEPRSGLVDPEPFDYVVVVGGTLHGEHDLSALHTYLQRCAAREKVLVGLCTGSFQIARAGLMKGRRTCVTWLHHDEFRREFPKVHAVADALYVLDRDRISCAGGTGVIHMTSHLVERHLGKGTAAKGLRIMLEDGPREGASPQPLPAVDELKDVRDLRVRRAVLLLERSLSLPMRAEAIAHEVGLSPRQLHRLLIAELGISVGQLRQRLRLARARSMIVERRGSLTAIATACGFADAAHFSRSFKNNFGTTPGGFQRSL